MGNAKKDRKEDRHKPRRMVGIPHRVAVALEEIANNREATLSEMVKVACIAFLEQAGKWPPPPHRSAERRK